VSAAPAIRGAAIRGAAIRWAQSGLMSLTGPERGAPLVPAFDAMTGIDELMDDLRSSALAYGARLDLDAGMLGGRAHLLNLRRGGLQSCNRSCRLLEARDGWIALSLPRPSDIEMLPAWLGIEIDADPWQAAAQRVGRYDRAELTAMAEGLPLAFAILPDIAEAAAPAAAPCARRSSTPVRVDTLHSPLAIDLSALWAGPLCGQLLRQAGARVIKVESAARPEPARQAWPVFFDLLNAGKESLLLDFGNRTHRARLRALIEVADIVISSARPRALEQLDLNPAELIRERPALVWIAITAHGWQGPNGQRVGFGDDAAVAAGLIATNDDGRPAFMGDAMADPLTGMSAAAAALRAHLQGAGGLYDISLRGCAERVANARRLAPPERGAVYPCGADWRLRVDDFEAPVSPPWAFPTRCERAAPAGAHTHRILEEFRGSACRR
jgi:crotonobetainyl-CoA:carnitine CoA-transferase CaiB-like acyl-CoA transferase